jgi:heat shock protein HtpX
MVSGPVTSYTRAERNRRNSRLLVAAFALFMSLPAAFLVWYAGNILFLFVVLLLGRQVLDSPYPFLIFLAALMAGMAGAIWIRALRVGSSLAERIGAVPTSQQPLLHRLENLAIAAGIPTPALYVLESRQPNAFATGLPTDGATVVVTDGLLEAVGERNRELDGILAHELAHICNEDTRLDSVLAAIIRTVRFPAPLYWIFAVAYVSVVASILMTPAGLSDVLEMWRGMFAARDEFLPARPVYLALFWVNVLGPIPFILWPAVARFIQSHISRQREFLADAEAATLTRDPIGLARALATISAERYEALSSWPEALRIPFIMPRDTDIAHQIGIEHLCIVLNRRGLFDYFFPTHPDPRDRIAALESMAPPECEVTAEAPTSSGVEPPTQY